MSLPFLRSLRRDRFLHLLIAAGIILSFFVPFRPRGWPASIDWHTIVTLSGLMLLTKGVEMSGYFDVLGRKMARRFATERRLALFMVLAAALLSTFLTNDVALFIVVPLTLTLKKWCALPVSRLIIFEALAVNAGSLLTPIGNPQNILLWGRSGLSFFNFSLQMAPLALAMMLTLLALCRCCFSGAALRFQSGDALPVWRPKLVWSCLGLYLIFLAALEMRLELWGLAAVAAGFLLLERQILVRVDWTLLLVFMAMFIDVHLLTQLPALHHALAQVGQLSDGGLWLTAIGLSQVISNVPATILLLNAVPPSDLLAWAVNVGGFGLLPGSLANLIALRMAGDRRIWWRFHLFSVPMLLWAMLAGFGLYLLIH
ncbi:anion transporter [Pluralibacter gergoviae]|uniref:anion transporter n=1 Tax=Pluralibacter gergoviae TaxID=61647 RepID=UPI000A390095|nr:anion transporter [Pluralibacter gergoviae]EKT9640181.1 anion transporter [Pluralibacter gergoviae]EKV3543304.1 anion transporter [Pluralibacter gergoviae]EKV9898433.1 anion transporter [Pluralibacter gergoviae]EKV9932741.1 anion transporter [Pluralibacter gergoviae]EKW9973817.1 anion transporter [Pluralibacter gergoviae]